MSVLLDLCTSRLSDKQMEFILELDLLELDLHVQQFESVFRFPTTFVQYGTGYRMRTNE